jgi:hypothetical protein
MREIKDYLILKKNVNVIKLDIGGELKHYPILSFNYDFTYDRSNVDELLVSKIEITIMADAFNLRDKLMTLMLLQESFNIHYGKNKYLRCHMMEYTKSDNNNSYKLRIVAEQLEIN